jgi:hypothetical protein
MPNAQVTTQFLQALQRSVGRPILPQSVRPNGVRVDPVQLSASIGTAAWVANDVLASLGAGTLAEASYPKTAPSGYYRSKGGTGNVYAGFVTGVSVDVQPSPVAIAAIGIAAFFALLEGVNLRFRSFGQYVELPLRECLRVFPNIANGDATQWASGACPGSGKPTYELVGGIIWDGDAGSDIELVANRAYTPAIASAILVDVRLWGTLASLDANSRASVIEGSLPKLPCDETNGVATLAAVNAGILTAG